MSEPREDFLNKVQMMLIGKIDEKTCTLVAAVVRMAADAYEIVERCTDIVVRENPNEDLMRNYQASLIIEGKRPKTVQHYLYQLQKLSADIGKDFRKMTTGDIKLYMAKRTAAGVSPRTVDNERACFSAFYAWMMNEDIIEKDPTAKIKKVKFQRTEENPFSAQDLALMRDTVKDVRDRAMIEFLLATGVRVTELVDMRKTDVKEDMSVTIREGKGGKRRITYISPTAMMYLKRYMATRKDNDDHLFITKNTAKEMDTDSVREMLHGIEKISGVQNIHPHRFRHTFATDLSNKGVPVTTIQELLGHTNLNTTMIYVNQSHERTHQDYVRAAV